MSVQAKSLTVPAVVRAYADADDRGEFLRLLAPGEPDTVLSYAELVAEADRWAGAYARLGLGHGDRVIVILRHSLDLYAAYAGALLGGQVPAMFAFPSPKFSEERYFATIDELIAGAGARVVVAYPELAAKLRGRGPATVVTAHDARSDGAPARPPAAADPAPASVAFLQYSSGTTGLKKGVAVSHRALLWQISAYGDAIGAGEEDRIVSWLPLYHDMGLIACFFLPLLRKVPIVAMSPFDWVADPASWARAVEEHGGTLSWLPNFAYALLAANAGAGHDLSSLRGVVNCSEPVLAASHAAFVERLGVRDDQLAASYAMAENTFAVTSAGFGTPIVVDHVDADAFARDGRAQRVAAGTTGARVLVSSGRALPETEIEIVGEDGAALPERHVGEIVLRSPCLLEAYDGNPEATAAALRGARLFTGDLGYLAGGELFVTGRKKDLVIVGGRNVYPQDVEAAAGEVAEVVPGRVVAVGAPDEALGTERLVVLAETRAPAAEHDAIRAAIHAAVVERTDAVPADIELVAPRSLLKSSSGKLARAANRDAYLARQAAAPRARAAPAPGPAPSGGGSGELVDVVRAAVADTLRALGRDPVALHDELSLLRSGLIDSFGIVELLDALRAGTGVEVAPQQLRELAAFDTVTAIAATLSALGAGPAAEHVAPLAAADIPMAAAGDRGPARTGGGGWWTALARLQLRRHGVRPGPGLHALGPILLQTDGGQGRNIHIGHNVTLMPGAHLKVRENGRIHLHDGVKLDTMTRLVAANDATLELGENVALGLGTVVNAGADVRVGRNSFTAAHCVLNASDHNIDAGRPMREQGYVHSPILVGEDVWVGAGALLGRGASVGHGAIVSAGAAVTGPVPAGAIVQGRPARVVKYRS